MRTPGEESCVLSDPVLMLKLSPEGEWVVFGWLVSPYTDSAQTITQQTHLATVLQITLTN